MILFAWVETSHVVAKFARIRYDLFYDIVHSLCFVSYQQILFFDMDLGEIIVLSKKCLDIFFSSQSFFSAWQQFGFL